MDKKLIAAAVAAALAAPLSAVAADAPAAPEHTVTGNLGLFSSYRFRGIDQTFGKPALQGGIDYAHASGLYLGNWNSNVSEGAGFPDGNLEMDFYGGYKTTLGDVGIDVGAIYYYYPGTDAGPATAFSPANNRTGRVHRGGVSNTEIYLGVSWNFLSAKYYYSVDDYFSAPGTDGTAYLDLSASFDLGDGWGINGHVGRLDFDNMSKASYTDWKIGVTKDVDGWLFGLAYVDSNARGSCNKGQFYCFANASGNDTKDAGRGMAVLSVVKSF